MSPHPTHHVLDSTRTFNHKLHLSLTFGNHVGVRLRLRLTLCVCHRYYGDTLSIIKGAECSHKFSKTKYTGPLSTDNLYALGNLYEATFGERFEGEHCAGDDARAGARLYGHPEFYKRRFNKSGGMRPISLLWDSKAEKREKKWAKLLRKVADGWVEGDTKPCDADLESEEYTSSKYGPGGDAKGKVGAGSAWPLVEYVLLFLPLLFLSKVAGWTNYYGAEQDVVRQGKKWVPVDSQHPRWKERRKRYQRKARRWVTVTPWYLLCWLGVLIRNGALRKRSIYQSWTKKYGLHDPTVADAIDRDSFAQVQQFCCWQDYRHPPTSAAAKKNKLWKVQPLLDHAATVCQQLWDLGVYMTIDESMILCKSRFVDWKQYMPLKPIKHGIKVFVLACGETGFVYNFSVYQGKGNGNIMETVLSKVITGDLINSERILFVDNYYTSVALAVVMLAVYGLYIVGTYSPRKGAKRDKESFPFEKLTPADASCVGRGWMRRAITTITRKAADVTKHVVVQAIIWKDSKVCGFISTAFVGMCEKSSVLRSTKGMFKSLKVKAHDAIIAYLSYYGAVDRADRGISDYTISVRCSRWFMRVVFWVLDVMLWNIWCIVQFRIDAGDKYYQQFKGNTGVPSGRYRFQLELADQLIAYSLDAAIKEVGGDRSKVKWAKQHGCGQFQSPMGSSSKARTPASAMRSPSDLVESPRPTACNLVPHGTPKSKYCQLCYQYRTDTRANEKVRRKTSKNTALTCEVCNVRVCADCEIKKYHAIHAKGKVTL